MGERICSCGAIWKYYLDFDAIDESGNTLGWHVIEARYSKEVFRGTFEQCQDWLYDHQEILEK